MSFRTQNSADDWLSSRTSQELLDRITERRRASGAFRATANRHRSFIERVADGMSSVMGSIPFLFFHVILFAGWLSFNLGLLPFVKPFDPVPFGLLTMLMTLEQSLLTIFIIMSQNRSSQTTDLRTEINLQVNMIAEEEISKTLQMLRLIGEHLEIKEIMLDPEVKIMEQPLDHAGMEKETQDELDSAPAARRHTEAGSDNFPTGSTYGPTRE
jgi:uncharacterized membrane protein